MKPPSPFVALIRYLGVREAFKPKLPFANLTN